MLVRFTVGNYKSFNKNQTLSLISGKVQNNKERLFDYKDFRVLKFATIFGANAAGKSNLLHAVETARDITLNSLDNPFMNNIKNDYYILDKSNENKNTYFEFEILIDDVLYAYGFELVLSELKIKEEWLIKLTKEKEIPLFIRNTTTKKIEFNEEYIGEESAVRMNIYIEDFQNVNNSLLLRYLVDDTKDELYKNNDKLGILRKIYNYIKSINISYPNTSITGYDYLPQENIEDILKSIKIFNTGISDIKLNKITKEYALKDVPTDTKNAIEADIARFTTSLTTQGIMTSDTGIKMNLNSRLIFITIEDGKPVFTEINFEHYNIKDVVFNIRQESEGTQRLLDILSVLYTHENNSIFFIDELDRSLHPILTKQFIKLYLDIAKKKNIQLVITSHESYLLDLTVLRQDEIYFIDSDNMGQSTIYPLDRFKERFDKKIEKAYLDGRYGAIPTFNFKDFIEAEVGE